MGCGSLCVRVRRFPQQTHPSLRPFGKTARQTKRPLDLTTIKYPKLEPQKVDKSPY
jgi:hypothetical protein